MYINKEHEKQLTYLLCTAEGTLNGDVNVDFCDKEAEKSNKSLNQLFETSCRLLVKAATNMHLGGVGAVGGVGGGGGIGGISATRDGPATHSLMVDSLRLELIDEINKNMQAFKVKFFQIIRFFFFFFLKRFSLIYFLAVYP